MSAWFVGQCSVCGEQRVCQPDPRDRLAICGADLYRRELLEIEDDFVALARLAELEQIGDLSYATAYSRLCVKEDGVRQQLEAWDALDARRSARKAA